VLTAVWTEVLMVFLRPSWQMLVEHHEPTTTALFQNLSEIYFSNFQNPYACCTGDPGSYIGS